MIKKTCNKGHFYDGEKYDECPVCSKVGGNTSSAGQKSDTDAKSKQDGASGKKSWLQGLIRTGHHTAQMEIPEENTEAPQMPVAEEKKETEDLFIKDDMELAKQASGKTVSLEELEQEIGGSNLAKQVSRAQEENLRGSKTVAFYGTEVEPVTGWLVCVKGEEQGMSYPLKTGQNFIGRALNMDVSLHQESSVSRNKHAVIIFDPKNQNFFIQPGESSGLTYVNDELMMSFVALKPYDRIQLGECLLIFVPFCGNQFSWSDYIEK